MATDKYPRHPIAFVKGRGAGSNRPSRFLRNAEERELCFPAPGARTEFTKRQARSLLNRNNSPDLSFDHTLNPYQGCEHGCVYCFARPNHAYLNLSPGLDFEAKLFAKVNAPELLRAELRRKNFNPGIVALGAATDAYQPIERTFQITRRVIEVLSEFNVAVGITTKSALVTRDIDLLAPMARKGLVRVHMSVPTLDHELSRKLDPRANSPSRRLQAIQTLTNSGIPVALYASPIIPLVNDHELEAIMEAAAARGATFALHTLIRLPREVRDLFVEWLYKWYPDRTQEVMQIIQAMHEGKDYDSRFGARLRGTGELAVILADRFQSALIRLGMSFPGRTLNTSLFNPALDEAQGTLF